jgi:hypothetical protein
MTSNPKPPTKDAPPDPVASERADTPEQSVPAMFATLYFRGLERMVQAHRMTLDMAVQQSTQAMDIWKRTLRIPSTAPGMFIFDLTTQAMNRYVETQKNVMDLMLEQGAAAMETTRERGDSASKMATGMAEVLQQSVERTVMAQKIILDFAAQQNRTATETVKQQFGVTGTPAAAAADSIQRGVDILIETQKDLLDIAAKPVKASSARA